MSLLPRHGTASLIAGLLLSVTGLLHLVPWAPLDGTFRRAMLGAPRIDLLVGLKIDLPRRKAT